MSYSIRSSTNISQQTAWTVYDVCTAMEEYTKHEPEDSELIAMIHSEDIQLTYSELSGRVHKHAEDIEQHVMPDDEPEPSELPE